MAESTYIVFETAAGARHGFEWPRTVSALRQCLKLAPDDAVVWARSSAKSLRCALNGLGRDVHRNSIGSLEEVEASWRNYRWQLVEKKTGWTREGELLRSPDGQYTARACDGAWELLRGDRQLELHPTIKDAVDAARAHAMVKIR